jgi:hypothetical protein
MSKVYVIWTLMLLVSSGLLAKTLNDLHSKDSDFGMISRCGCGEHSYINGVNPVKR